MNGRAVGAREEGEAKEENLGINDILAQEFPSMLSV